MKVSKMLMLALVGCGLCAASLSAQSVAVRPSRDLTVTPIRPVPIERRAHDDDRRAHHARIEAARIKAARLKAARIQAARADAANRDQRREAVRRLRPGGK